MFTDRQCPPARACAMTRRLFTRRSRRSALGLRKASGVLGPEVAHAPVAAAQAYRRARTTEPRPHGGGGGGTLCHIQHSPRHTNDWAPRTRKRHQREHRPQRPTERSDPTQHAEGRTGDRPGPRKETATRRNVTGGGGRLSRSEDADYPPPPKGASLFSLSNRADMSHPFIRFRGMGW